MALYEYDGGYSISFKGQELMQSKVLASELLLGKLGSSVRSRMQSFAL